MAASFHLEQSLTAWREQMLAAGIGSPVPLEELEAHLREEIDRQLQAGLSEPEAFHAAVQNLGPAVPLKTEFTKTAGFRGWFGRDKVTRINRILGMLWMIDFPALLTMIIVSCAVDLRQHLGPWILVGLIILMYPYHIRSCLRLMQGDQAARKYFRKSAKNNSLLAVLTAGFGLYFLFFPGFSTFVKICFLAWSAYSFFLCLATLRHLPANGTAAPKPAR